MHEFRKVSATKKRQFSVDLALVAISMRTAYLVDVVTLNDPVKVFSSMIQKFRKGMADLPVFANIVHLHESASGQSFFLNIHMFQKAFKCLDTSLSERWISFVSLDDESAELSNPPSAVLEAISKLGTTLSTQVELVETITISESLGADPGRDVMVPLAAFLLEYPVAYVPTSLVQSSFLSGVCLDIYDCILARPHHITDNVIPLTHSFLKFSSPRRLGLEHPSLSPPRLIRDIATRYEARLREMGSNFVFKIQYHTRSFDQITL